MTSRFDDVMCIPRGRPDKQMVRYLPDPFSSSLCVGGAGLRD
jgi:hypothetical protein